MNHLELVQRLAKPGSEIRRSLTGLQCHIWHMATGISTEAGELADQVKKHVIYQKALDRENVVEELGDLEFYMEGLRQSLDITREEVIQHNIAKLTKRYGNGPELGYTDRAAIQRADKAEDGTINDVLAETFRRADQREAERRADKAITVEFQDESAPFPEGDYYLLFPPGTDLDDPTTQDKIVRGELVGRPVALKDSIVIQNGEVLCHVEARKLG